MRFEVEGAAPIDGPTREQLEEGLRTLERDGRDYAILERQPATYLQTAPNGDGTYVLEIQEGSLDQHYRALRQLQLADLNTAFDAYRTGSDVRLDVGWQTMYEWQPIDSQGRPQDPAMREVSVGPRLEARMASGGRRSTLQSVIWAALLLVLFLSFALVFLWWGVSATMAGTGAAGVPGRVLVTSCKRAGCSGLFTASSGEIPPSRVSVAGGPYRTPALVPDVHLLNGQAYPPAGDMVSELVFFNVLGVFCLAGAAYAVVMILRPESASKRLRGGRTGG